jgi:hypothetical protein
MEVRERKNLSTVVLSLLGSGVSTISLVATSCAVVLEYALYSNLVVIIGCRAKTYLYYVNLTSTMFTERVQTLHLYQHRAARVLGTLRNSLTQLCRHVRIKGRSPHLTVMRGYSQETDTALALYSSFG